MNTSKLEIFSEEIRRETARQGGWGKKDSQGKVLVVLIFGVPSGMARIDFKRKCNEVGLYCFTIGKLERRRELLGVTLKPKASMEWQKIETEKVSAWVRTLGWRVCIANGIAKLRRNPRLNEGKGREETVSESKEMGDKHRGAGQTDKTRNGNVKNAHRRDDLNTRSDNGEGTTGKTRADSETKNRLIVGSWNVCGFATEERKGIEIAEQPSKRDLDIVGIQKSWDKEGGGI